MKIDPFRVEITSNPGTPSMQKIQWWKLEHKVVHETIPWNPKLIGIAMVPSIIYVVLLWITHCMLHSQSVIKVLFTLLTVLILQNQKHQ